MKAENSKVQPQNQPKQSYMVRSNLEYIEELYQKFLADPESVGLEWKYFFEGMEVGKNLEASPGLSKKDLAVHQLIQIYRNDGHFEANLNPLRDGPPEPKISYKNFGLSEGDLKSVFEVDRFFPHNKMPLSDILEHLKKCYCGTISFQFGGAMPEIREWFQNEVEKETKNFALQGDEKVAIYKQITRTEGLEKFLHRSFVGVKRFSIEGADALVPMLERLVLKGSYLDVKEIVIGMAHRGRVNVLTNFMGQGLDIVLAKFDGKVDNEFFEGGGDVKYHLGFSTDKPSPNGPVHVSLAFNPSHLEMVNPVVLGITRAKQRVHKDTSDRKKVVPVLIHGDAAFAGQGIVAETFQQSQLEGYRVGGTIHIVTDNQVGFTTDPVDTRSSPYSSDVAKALLIPVIHVNGDDVEACVRAMEMALRYRQRFKQDIVINVICYRRFGHNEGDEPAFTQPLMYQKIEKHPTLRRIYAQKIVSENVMKGPDADMMFEEVMGELQKILNQVREKPPKLEPPVLGRIWSGMRHSQKGDFDKAWDTTVSMDVLKKVGKVLTSWPSDFAPHPKLLKLLERRKNMIDDKEPVDWGMAELLCYGSLLSEGTSVRLTGQDVIRGTFTHRHAGFFDHKTGKRFIPLKDFNPNAEFCIYNSLLSELGVLGFEYGNSIGDPTFLTIWEAQFGDFANGAQIIIDQFLASGEAKWLRMSGLVCQLPHGYEGQGPEHSSARLERFLQLCAQDNIQVANVTTPAQIFHLLRRQMKRPFRKPLFITTPKSLLRHPQVVSSMNDLSKGTFQEVIDDGSAKDKNKIDTLVFSTGKIFYDLVNEREKRGKTNYSFIRIEQIYPHPNLQLKEILAKYPGVKKVIWAQEEPKNMGAYTFINPWLKTFFPKIEVEYCGRPERASPATGSPHAHTKEQNDILQKCFA